MWCGHDKTHNVNMCVCVCVWECGNRSTCVLREECADRIDRFTVFYQKMAKSRFEARIPKHVLEFLNSKGHVFAQVCLCPYPSY